MPGKVQYVSDRQLMCNMCQKGVWVRISDEVQAMSECQVRCKVYQNVRMPGEVHAESECQVRCKLCQDIL